MAHQLQNNGARNILAHAITPMRYLGLSLMFLTRLPIPFASTFNRPKLSDAMSMFGVAGAAIGAIGGGLLVLLQVLGVPSHLGAAVTVALLLLITGALHEDGLADVADGFGGGRNRVDRLSIMRDSRIGTYGTLALVMALGIKILALAEIGRSQWFTVVILSATSAAFSRAMIVDLMWSTRPARSDGLSHMVGRPDRQVALIAILTGVLFVAMSGYFFRVDAALFAIAAGTLAAALMRSLAIRYVDGQTGDVCGATQVLVEIAMLIVFAAMVR
jgi:adenosylcobinamide-GDP ribazoletransferase